MAIVRSQETSSPNSQCSYDVCLSFRGEDTRKTFTDHLYTALVHAGFRTFRDDDGIERGENIKFELNTAIQESKISIVVFSEDYASSSWCLDELVMILERRRTVGHIVLPVFYHVDPSHVSKQKGSFKEACTRHEERFHAEASERMEAWKAALKEAAALAGMNLQNQTDGLESKFIQKIVKVVGEKLSRTALGTDPHLIGIYSRAKNIGLWLQDESSDVGIVAICGMGGMGKTTIAKELYNSNFSRFEGSSFLANVREIVKQQDGLLQLQRQLLSDMLKGRKENLYNVDEGVVKIKNALCCKKVLVVLDDVDTKGQLDAILGMRDWLSQGSKIIITTRREQLFKAHEICRVHKVEKLDNDESLELFSWHAFGKNHPKDGFIEDSKRVVQYCGGLPLAIKILGASLSGSKLDVWKSQLQKLKAIPNSEVIEKLKISYDSLLDDHDKNLFLHVAFFFVGMDKDQVVTILDGCDFYTTVGIQNLIDGCLLTIDEQKKLVMHQLVQEMGREIVRQESPKEPGERSRLWNYKDSLNVLRENTLLESLKVLDLSHSHCLTKTPDFSKVPNLERLILKNCATLVEVHESVGHLQRLVLFNLKDCRSLKKLPRSIGMLKFLETLDISGCSNLEGLPTELGTMESLTVFYANEIDISQLFSTSKEVKSWHSLIWPSLLKPRRSMEISWSFLPRSVVHLSLENCNLSDDDFPRDLSNLSSLQELKLSGNAIRSVPNCIRDHFGLQYLYLMECKKLRSVEVLHKLKMLWIGGCILLEKVTFQSFPCIEYNNVFGNVYSGMNPKLVLGNVYSLIGMNPKLVEIQGVFKLEPLGNVDMEIINNLSLSNIGLMGCSNVLLSSNWSMQTRKLPLQGCHGRFIFYAYCLGSKVPDWFNLKNEGSSISFTVPPHLNFRIRIRCLSVCSIYALSNKRKEDYCFNCYDWKPDTTIYNTTKSLMWRHSPHVWGIPEADEDMMMLSYWKFENQLESGDELNISVSVEEPSQIKKVQVKEVGVHLVYKEQEEKSSQSTSEEASQQLSVYGNVIPGNLGPGIYFL